MILRRNKRTVPQLNTTSTADISFILLVFFLIMTSMDTDKGLARMLPPANKEDRQETTTDIERSNVLSIRLTAANRLTVDGKACDIGRLREKVTAFVENAADRQGDNEKDRQQYEKQSYCHASSSSFLPLKSSMMIWTVLTMAMMKQNVVT